MELYYCVRKDWQDKKSQVGINYKILNNAIKARDRLSDEYSVFDSNGILIYPEKLKEETNMDYNFKEGDIVQFVPNAVLESGRNIPEELINAPIHIRKVNDNTCTVARKHNGPALGNVATEFLVPYQEANFVNIEPYFVKVVKESPLYASAANTSRTLRKVRRGDLFTIVDEKDNFGKIKIGAGWIDLSKVIKL
jgi:hypothetical protein